MTCCGGKPLPTPGTGRAAGFTRGDSLVYRILDSETDDCILGADGECLHSIPTLRLTKLGQLAAKSGTYVRCGSRVLD